MKVTMLLMCIGLIYGSNNELTVREMDVTFANRSVRTRSVYGSARGGV